MAAASQCERHPLCVRVSVTRGSATDVDAAMDTFLGRNSIFEAVLEPGAGRDGAICTVPHDIDFALRAWIDVVQHPEVAGSTPASPSAELPRGRRL